MKKVLFLSSIIIFILIYSVNVNAANLLYSTNFDDLTLTIKSGTIPSKGTCSLPAYTTKDSCQTAGGTWTAGKSEVTLQSIPFSNIVILEQENAEVFVESGTLVPPRGGVGKCLGLKSGPVGTGVRAEAELTHLDGTNPWPQSQSLPVGDGDFYLSVWLYFPNDWSINPSQGAGYSPNWYELMNPILLTDVDGAGNPRFNLHIHRDYLGVYQLTAEYDAAGGGSGGLGSKIWWDIINNWDLNALRGRWTKWAYFLHRSADSNEAYAQIWLNDQLLGVDSSYKLTDRNGQDAYGGNRNFHFRTKSDGTRANWWTTYAKSYLNDNQNPGDGKPHYIFVDDLEIWDGIPTQEYATLSGKLINKTGSAVNTTISVDSANINTNSNGDYSLSVPKGVYDINYSTQNLWIKLIFFNLISDQNDLVNYITKTSSKTSFQLNISNNQLTQVYSDKKPSNVSIDGIMATEVSSLPALTNNTWFYNSSEKSLYMIVSIGGETVSKYKFTIYKSGTDTCMKDANEKVVVCDTNSSYLINSAITNVSLGGGGSILVENGSYSLSSSISMKSNAVVYVQLGVTFTVTYTPTVRQGIVDFRGVTNAHFLTETEPADESEYPKIIGQGISNNESGVLMTYSGSTRTTNSSVGKIAFSNIGGYGICLRYADYNVINGTYVHGFAKADGSDHQGLTIRVGSYNKLINCHIDAELGQYANHPLYFGGEGAVTYNEVIGGIYENSAITHAIYWCSETNASLLGSSHYGWYVANNTAYGGISRGCHGSHPYATGFKLNAAINSSIGIRPDGTTDPWVVYDSWTGFEFGDGNSNGGGNYGNLVYIKVINCRKGSEWFTQNENMHVQNNEVHIDIDGNDSNYPKVPGTEGRQTDAGLWGLCLEGGIRRVSSLIQYNTIYLKVRNVQNGGILFIDWDNDMTETQQPIHNTFYCDIEVNNHAIYWSQGSAGFGTYNIFDGYWYGAAGNCPTIPNATYVYTDNQSFIPNMATNTFIGP